MAVSSPPPEDKPILLAIAAVEELLNHLDLSNAPCPTCGTVRHNNFQHYQRAVELRAMVRKLKKFADAGDTAG